jgi:hypothetical protein
VSRSTLKSNVSPPNVARGLEPAGDGELAGLERVRDGQQAVLDLGLERERQRTLTPLVEVGEPTIGDHDVGQRVRGQSNAVDRALVGRAIERQLQDADRLAAAGHRSEQPTAAVLDEDLDLLLGQRAPLGGADQRHGIAALASVSRGSRIPVDVAETDERLPAVIGDEEADVARVERFAQRLADDVCRRDRRRRLHRREQHVEVEGRAAPVGHCRSLAHDGGAAPRSGASGSKDPSGPIHERRAPVRCASEAGERGGRYWARTSDLRLVEAALSQLS